MCHIKTILDWDKIHREAKRKKVSEYRGISPLSKESFVVE